MKKLLLSLIIAAAGAQLAPAKAPAANPEADRVVNIINFVRFTEPRRTEIPQIAWITDSVLLATVDSQIRELRHYGLPATFLLQYDALIDSGHQQLMKSLPENCEVGAWWEITKPHVEDAGYEWHGRYPWDWYANAGFSIAYTPEQRLRLVDVYMEKFKEVFGQYPKSVGSWFIDAVTLDYMQQKYGIEASTACRDQLGTDGYNLWGGYWQGAYYPSKNNMYIPAQTAEEQINVPVFRMLGSDPIRQYDQGLGGRHQGVVTLEPVYGNCGGDIRWINWFFDTEAYDPAMGMTYFQSGQENSFTWPRMKNGLRYQWPVLAAMAKRGDITLQTLGDSGRDFSKKYRQTPPTALLTMSDRDSDSIRTLWFNCKNYRLNLMWQGDHMFVRDIHVFDETQPSLYLTDVCTTPHCEYFTLPLVDGNVWSNDSIRGSLRFYRLNRKGQRRQMAFGTPEMTVNDDSSELTLTVPVKGSRDAMVVTLNERCATFRLLTPGKAKTQAWQMALEYAPEAKEKLPFGERKAQTVAADFRGNKYSFDIAGATFASSLAEGVDGAATEFVIIPDYSTITMNFAR